jgi:hypothetical protein
MDITEGMEMNRAFVFSTTGFLLIIPAVILAASFLHIVKSGEDAAIMSTKSDVTLYTYKNIRASFNKASCSYFLLLGSDTSAIISNLTDEWASYIEANYTGLNITIAKSQIDVTYNSDENSIKVGNINDINDGIPVNVTYQDTTIAGELGPLETQSNCDVVAPGGEAEELTPRITLFLRSGNELSFTEGTSSSSTHVTLSEGSSVTWMIDPLYENYDFNITGNIDFYLYLDPTVDLPKYPDLTLTLTCGLCNPSVLAIITEDQITSDTADWYVITVSPATGTIIPKGSNLSLTLSVPDVPGGVVSIDIYYDSSEYNSGMDLPGNTSVPDETAPTFSGLVSATNAETGGAINLDWNAASDPSVPITYYIYISTSGTFNYGSENYTTQDVYYNVTGLTNGQWYNFVVRAQDSASNMDTNTVNRSATPSGAIYEETIYSSGSYTGSSDTFDSTILLNDDNKKVVVDRGDIEIADFDDPAGTVTNITSAIIYWIDKARIKGGAGVNDANRTIDAGDGIVWTWGTYGPATATGVEQQYSLDISSHFDGVGDDTDIADIRLRYTSNDTTGKVDFHWDQVYIVIRYT